MNFNPNQGIFASVHIFRTRIPVHRQFQPCAPGGPRLTAHAAEPNVPEVTLKQSIPLTDTAIISKLEIKVHLLLVNSQKDRWALYNTSLHRKNRYQCYILRLGIMLQVYNSSLSCPSSWFGVENNRAHRHGRSSFIVYPFPLWSQTKPPNRLPFVVGFSLFFSMTTNWLPKK